MDLSKAHIFPGRVEFVRHAIGGRPLRFLDVGNLGDGASTNLINKRMVEEAGGTYMGLDSNADLTAKLNLPNQSVGDIHGTDLPDGHADMVYLGEVIEHTWEPAKVARECWRILSAKGELVIDTPNPFSVSSLLRYVFQKRDSMGDNRALTYHEARYAFDSLRKEGKVLLQPQHKIFFSPAMLRQMLETQGFTIALVGFTRKPRNLLQRALLAIAPQCGQHLCMVARKATVDEAFEDVRSAGVTSA